MYLVSPDDKINKLPAVVLIHEVWGLSEHIKDVANRLSKKGYNVLAPDLLSQTGVTEKIDQTIMKDLSDPETRGEAQKRMREATVPIRILEFGIETVEKLKSCVTYLLHERHSNGNIGVVGFCFVGTCAYALAVSDPRIKAAVPFYGHAPDPLDKLQSVSCSMLAFYGDNDTELIKQLSKIKKTMKNIIKISNTKLTHKLGIHFSMTPIL